MNNGVNKLLFSLGFFSSLSLGGGAWGQILPLFRTAEMTSHDVGITSSFLSGGHLVPPSLNF